MEPPLKRHRIAGSQEQLHEQRARNDLRLKSRFENIFEKFSKDFTGVGDEIDLHTGKVIVNNGHLITMQNERDIQGLANDEDELAADAVGSLIGRGVDKSDVSAGLQGSLATTAEAVKILLPLPMEVPCVGLNIASAIKMDDGTTYDTNIHGDLFINRTILNQLSRLGPHIRKSIANVKRSAATSVVVSVETEDLTVDPKWRVPVLLQQTPDEEVQKAVGSSDIVEADSKITECDPERSPSPEGVSLWALDSMSSSRKGISRRDAATNAPRPKDQAPKNSKPKVSRPEVSKPENPKAKVPKSRESTMKGSSPEDPRPAHLMPDGPNIEDTNFEQQSPMISMQRGPGPKDPKRGESRHVDPGSKIEASHSTWTADEENMLRNQRTECLYLLAEPTERAVGENSGVSAESQAPGSCEAGKASHNVTSPSLALKSRKRGRPSLARGLEEAHDSPASHHINIAVVDQPTSEKTISVEIPKQSIEVPKPRKRKATKQPILPEQPRILSGMPEVPRNNSPAPVALEKEPELVAQASSLPKARVPVRSIVAGLPPPVHDAAKKSFRKPAKTHGKSGTPPLLSKSHTCLESTMSSVKIPKDMTTRYPVSPSTPDNIVNSVEVDSSVRTRVPVGDAGAKRRHATMSISSSPDPVASLSKKSKNVTQVSPSSLSSRKATAQQHARKPTPKKKRQVMSASFAPRVSLSSVVGDTSDDEISNINAKD